MTEPDLVANEESSLAVVKVPVPAPVPEEPAVGDKCDSTFSLDDCKGGKAGMTVCDFPNGTQGTCWSGGPKFADGSWDCNVCKP
jgi:hypothetical protein